MADQSNRSTLQLRFTKSELCSCAFCYNEGDESKEITTAIGDPHSNNLTWSDVGVRAFSFLFLTYAVSGKNSGSFSISDKDELLIASIARQLESPGWICDVFYKYGSVPSTAGDSKTVLKRLFKPRDGDNRSGKAKGIPRIVRIHSDRLPASAIRIVRDGQELLDPGDIEVLRSKVAAWKLAPSAEVQSGLAGSGIVNKATILPRHNLPPRPSVFFGHASLCSMLQARLQTSGITVIHDAGGMGKTTLAKWIGYTVFDQNIAPAGIVWLDCEKEPSFSTLVEITAEQLCPAIPVGEKTSRLVQQIKERLAGGHALFVIDNLETKLHDEEFNRFIYESGKVASILITTREIHDDFRPHIVPFTHLDANSAVELFTYEARQVRSNWNVEDVEMLRQLCDKVGGQPLAVQLLGRQAAFTTLKALNEELQRNFDVLATDGHFREPRHRSIMACFNTSFERLNPEDQDTLIRMCIPPYGLHREIVGSYLQKDAWLRSLQNVLNSALLKLDGDRYTFHPLVRAFIEKRIEPQRVEWEGQFVDFFCERLDDASGRCVSVVPLVALEPLNCEAALFKAHELDRDEFQLLWYEVYGRKRSGIGSDLENYLSTNYSEAHAAGDFLRAERILILNLETGSPEGEEASDLLEKLADLNPFRAKRLLLVNQAIHQLKENNLAVAAELLRESLNCSTENETSRSPDYSFDREQQAALFNMFTIACDQKADGQAEGIAQSLWKLWSEGVKCKLHYIETERIISWAIGLSLRDLLSQAANRKIIAMPERNAFEYVGLRLARLRNWAEAERWIERAFALVGPKHDQPSAWRLATYAECLLRLGRPDDALDFCRSWIGRKGIDARFCLTAARVAAEVGQLRTAIDLGNEAIDRMNSATLLVEGRDWSRFAGDPAWESGLEEARNEIQEARRWVKQLECRLKKTSKLS